MEGGRILGEGVDGCIVAAPMWPCASGTEQGHPPDPTNRGYVSKIVSKTDDESEYLKTAARILGPELSTRYLAGIKGECSPANSSHPPPINQIEMFKTGKDALLHWDDTDNACGKLKRHIKDGKGIADSHKIMYISRYPMTVYEWIEKHRAIKRPAQYAIQDTINAIPKFLEVLQKLVQNPSEQLIHIDLHVNNMFVRSLNKTVEFGIADFGRCLLRRPNNNSDSKYFGGFLSEYIVRYSFYSGFSQVPLEARLLDFCYQKKHDTTNPGQLVKAWFSDPDVVRYKRESADTDIIMIEPTVFMNHLLTKSLFISMVEYIQSISKKVRVNPTNSVALTESLTQNEKIVLDFILTRYAVVSPINTIVEEVLTIASGPTPNAQTLIEFVTRIIMAPYDQVGSSLVASVTSVRNADLRIVWADVVRGA